jgi:uncharacterized protein
MKVAVTGSSGLIGTALTASLRADGHQVVRLVRRPPRGDGEVRWDPRAADAGEPPLGGVDAVVHLAGAGVADHRWTAAYKAEIRASRVLPTRALASALASARLPPRAFIVASAIGWYGDTGGREVTEDAPAGQAFLSRVVHDWEAAADPARDAGLRVAQLRSGLVLGAGGGVLARLALPARFGVLPRFGDGQQVMSWISLTDEVRAIRFLLDEAGADGRSGPYNLTAPNPVTDAELTAALHAYYRRPDFGWPRVPTSLLKLGLGEMSSELLTSARVLPARLLDAGFAFESPTAGAALAAELRLPGWRQDALAACRCFLGEIGCRGDEVMSTSPAGLLLAWPLTHPANERRRRPVSGPRVPGGGVTGGGVTGGGAGVSARGTDAEQRDLPQRGKAVLGQPVAAGALPQPAHRHHGRQPDQTAGRVEHQQGQRQLDQQGGGDAAPDLGGARVEHHVKPGVAAQQGAGDDEAADDDLAAAPERPAGRREREQQEDVEADPGALPVLRVEGAVQGENQHDDPADQHRAGNDRDSDAQLAAAPQVDAEQRVRVVERGQ